ncbi:hypothetical protein BDN72DRAFT_177416 [Pluteus cervinus]|uniref:Uncharacterized protein n=1 Tax=Pluteus cervinus TaxID=181527 RepID=A0ACD3AJN6_9AGAR|nr:hypothetical protein BDN72DRAFT_177416 [Pluteus cervinus]
MPRVPKTSFSHHQRGARCLFVPQFHDCLTIAECRTFKMSLTHEPASNSNSHSQPTEPDKTNFNTSLLFVDRKLPLPPLPKGSSDTESLAPTSAGRGNRILVLIVALSMLVMGAIVGGVVGARLKGNGEVSLDAKNEGGQGLSNSPPLASPSNTPSSSSASSSTAITSAVSSPPMTTTSQLIPSTTGNQGDPPPLWPIIGPIDCSKPC